MKWFKRCLWLAAWGVWLWCGFGLYRELPRSPGPILKHLSPPTDWYYLPSGAGLVVGRKHQNGDVLIWDAKSGNLLHSIPCTDRLATVSSRHGVLIAKAKRPRGDNYSALDFRTVAWTDLKAPAGKIFHIHRDEPWAAVSIDEGSSPSVAVVDLHSGAIVAQWRAAAPPKGNPPQQVCAWYFLGGKEIAVVLETKDGEKSRRRQRLERWTLDGEQLAAPISLDPPFDAFADEPASGRIVATRILNDGFSYHVLDLRSGRSILDGDLMGEVYPGRNTPTPPQLSASGRRLLTGQGVLRNIDDAQIIWSPRGPFESISSHVSSDAAFPILEQWNKLSERWPWLRSIFSRPTMTMAVRDFETGAVRYRSWLPFMTLKFKSEDQGFGMAMLENEPGTNNFSFGIVDHPPRANWLLIVICQAILALPHILVWALLSYRRRRAARRQPAVATLNR